MAITGLIVDAEDDVRALIRLVIEVADEGLQVAGEAADREEALLRWQTDRPLVIVLDDQMPGMTGLEVAEVILTEDPEQKIVLFSAFLDEATVAAARRAGVRRCLDKTNIARLPEELWALSPGA
jgi:DNA-binding NarL/FixJ family response regulator